MPPTLPCSVWVPCRDLTPDSGRRSPNRTMDVGFGRAQPERAMPALAGLSTAGRVLTRPITLRGANGMDPSPMGSNWTTCATTPTSAPVANASTGAASTRITFAPLLMPITVGTQSKTGVRPVTSTRTKTVISMRVQAAERVGPAEPQRGLRKSNAHVSGRSWGLALARWATLGGDPSRSGWWVALTLCSVNREGE